jgi:hypothetical protein
MRPIARIDNFLEKVDWKKLKDRWGLGGIYAGSNDIREEWLKVPDQRVGQLMINLGLIPDNFKIWNDEEYEILKDQGLPPEEYLFWGSIYDKDMNPIPLKYRLVKDMDTDHIEKVLSLYAEEKLSTEYITAFTNVLKSINRNYSIGDFGHYHAFYTMSNKNNNDTERTNTEVSKDIS